MLVVAHHAERGDFADAQAAQHANDLVGAADFFVVDRDDYVALFKAR